MTETITAPQVLSEPKPDDEQITRETPVVKDVGAVAQEWLAKFRRLGLTEHDRPAFAILVKSLRRSFQGLEIPSTFNPRADFSKFDQAALTATQANFDRIAESSRLPKDVVTGLTAQLKGMLESDPKEAYDTLTEIELQLATRF